MFQYFSGHQNPVWFIYPGMGSQRPKMGKDLMKIPVFAKSIQKCHDALVSKGINLIKNITDDDKAIMDDIVNVFTGIAAISVIMIY